MTHLPISLKIAGRNGDEAIVATESGHLFRIPMTMVDSATTDGFMLEALEVTASESKKVNHAMTRALLNEIIGAPTTAAGTDAETQRKNR